MNVALRVKSPPDAASIAHSVTAYDRKMEELATDLPIPSFLDSLALKIAQVPREDAYGAASYPLTAKAVDTFRFLLGLDVDPEGRDYFIEASPGRAPNFSPAKIEAISILSEVSPQPSRRRTQRISEGELVVPTLRILETSNRAWTLTTELIARGLRSCLLLQERMQKSWRVARTPTFHRRCAT